MENNLVIYYSKSGNTRLVANKLRDIVNADIYEIKMNKENTSDLGDMLRLWVDPLVPFQNVSSSQKIDLTNYENIFIGTPVWGMTFSLPVKEFMQANDFEGKNVRLFATHDGGLGGTLRAMKRNSKGAKSIKTLDIVSNDCRKDAFLSQRLLSWIYE